MRASRSQRVAPLVRTLMASLKRMLGMPDYAAHVTHLKACHPDRAVPSEREYYDEFIRARYGGGPTRCC